MTGFSRIEREGIETWKQLSEDALRAAEVLLREGHYRSSISRSYYAAYCAATNEIVQKLTTFSHGWKNPTHEKVPTYVQNNLTLPQVKKDSIATDISILRLFREDADYRPRMEIDASIARDCLRVAATIQQELWGVTPLPRKRLSLKPFGNTSRGVHREEPRLRC